MPKDILKYYFLRYQKKLIWLNVFFWNERVCCIAEVAHQSDWDGIVACHQGYITCTTWNYQKTSMGIHKLRPEEFSKNKPVDIYATVSLFIIASGLWYMLSWFCTEAIFIMKKHYLEVFLLLCRVLSDRSVCSANCLVMWLREMLHMHFFL